MTDDDGYDRLPIDPHQRRQDIIVALGVASLMSFLGFLAFGGPLLVVNVVIDVLLLAYVAAVLAVTRRARMGSSVHVLGRDARAAGPNSRPAAVFAAGPVRRTASR